LRRAGKPPAEAEDGIDADHFPHATD
jgi:hypothetical protein